VTPPLHCRALQEPRPRDAVPRRPTSPTPRMSSVAEPPCLQPTPDAARSRRLTSHDRFESRVMELIFVRFSPPLHLPVKNAINGSHEDRPFPLPGRLFLSLLLSIKGSRALSPFSPYPSSPHLSSSPRSLVYCSSPEVAVRRRSSPEPAVRRRSHTLAIRRP
jgi:hypothetical protein